MDRDSAVGRIQDRLGFRADLATTIQNALKDAQAEFERDPILPWFLRKEDLTALSTISGTETVVLPADFLREVEDDALHYFNSTAVTAEQWTALKKDDIQFLRKALPGSGAPQAYWLGVSNLFIFPTPDAIYSLKFIYKAADTVLTSNIENNWLLYASEYMIGRAGRKVAAPLRDFGALAEFEKMDTGGKIKMFANSEAREHENRRYVMGGED